VIHKGPGAYAQRCLRGLAALSVTLSLTACAPAMRRQVVSPLGIAPLVPAYSVAIRGGDMVFVSGMTGIKPGTQEIIDGGVAALDGYQNRSATTSSTSPFSMSMSSTSLPTRTHAVA
jgi:hypothetical protein